MDEQDHTLQDSQSMKHYVDGDAAGFAGSIDSTQSIEKNSCGCSKIGNHPPNCTHLGLGGKKNRGQNNIEQSTPRVTVLSVGILSGQLTQVGIGNVQKKVRKRIRMVK